MKQFVRQRLELSETVDIYLADLRRLVVPFGGATDCIPECAFLAGLPDDVSRLLRVSLRLDELGIDELLARAQNILKDTELVAAAARATKTLSERQHAAGDSTMPRPWESPKCYRCRGHAILNVLVAHERALGYNLLIGIDTIRVLGGVTIIPAGDVKLGGGKEACAALCVDEPDFDASFNHNELIWTAR